ncbi:MAG: HEPN domain-containing protein [Burkholderiales bacterium]|nr:HEPN domain-containing protein [Burkholderiales bacterium]
MKATLFKHGVLVPRTHNIAQLLDVLDDAAIPAPPHADEIDSLNPYAVQARYGTLDAGALDRQVVEVWVNEVLAWAGLQVSGAGSA